MAAKRQKTAEKVLREAGFDRAGLVHIPPEKQRCGFGRTGIDVWIEVNRGLVLFVTAEATPETFEGMAATLYGFGEEGNQRVLGVGKDVACFIVGSTRAQRMAKEGA